jgi:hypothetical protein
VKNTNALIILAKFPHKDYVKTRLIRYLTDDERLKLYTSLLENTINKLKDIQGVDSFIAYSPRNTQNYFSKFELGLFPQSEGDIGERMFNALSRILTGGYQKAVLVGVDIPDISSTMVLKAFELLSDYDIVFGPARDGGYYLVGLKTLIKEIFEGIEWSTEKTLKQSIKKAMAGGYSVVLTEMLLDIDTIEDVKKAGLL